MPYRTAITRRGAVFRRNTRPTRYVSRNKTRIRRPWMKYRRRRGRVGGLRKSYKCRLRYSEFITLNASSLSPLAMHVFSANGLYDPDFTGTGHQPYGFDDLMKRYDHYTVIGSRCKARVVDPGTANANRGILAIHLADNTTNVFNGVTHLLESPDVSAKTTTGLLEGGQYAPPGKGNTISKGFSMKKFFHKNLGDSDMRGDVNFNPSEGAYFQIIQGSIAGNDPGVTTIYVEIDYHVVFTEPKILAQS